MAVGLQQGGNEAVSLEKLANAISAAMPRMDATDQRIAAGLWNQPGPDIRDTRRT